MNIDVQRFLNQITQDKKKLFFAIIIFFIILCLDFSFILRPLKATVKSFNTNIVKIKQDLKNLKLDLTQMQSSINKPASLKIKKIISEGQISWLIEEIYKLSNEHKVNILQIRPAKETKSLATGPAIKYTGLLLNVDMSCHYPSLLKFLSALENHSAIMAIDELEIKRGKKDMFSQDVILTIKTYVKK